MAIAMLGTITSNDKALWYLASVFDSISQEESVAVEDKNSIAPQVIENYVQVDFGPDAAIILTNKLEDSYAKVGAISATIMEMKVSGFGANLTKVVLKIVGVDESKIPKMYLYEDENLITEAENRDGIFELKNIKEKTYKMKVELSPALQAGDRFRMDTEYPVKAKGPYMTIIGAGK